MRSLSYLTYLAIPLAYVCHYWLGHDKSWEPATTFALAGIGVIPLAKLMGESTEQLAEHAGPTWGGLLNATFGNAAELIIGFIALYKGLNDIVRASLTGSILGNLLLVSGAAMVAGGWNREKQTFSRAAAEVNAGMLVMAVAAMLFPAIFHLTYHYSGGEFLKSEHAVSFGTSVILLIVYALGLLFTLRTHSHLFTRAPAQSEEDTKIGIAGLHGEHWTVRKSVTILLVASVAIGFLSELLVGSAELMAHTFGWNDIFVGIILLAIIGNAAEHSTAILLARRNDMDTAMTITYQSSLQIALFAVPFLVLASGVMTHFHMGQTHTLDLLFSPMEVVAVILSVAIVVVLNMDGNTNWFEGALLLALYMILGVAFFYIPEVRVATVK
jgi:Ca2+:H+ antiporter